MKSTIPSQQSPVSNRLSKSGLFASLPPVWPEDLRPRIRAAVSSSARKLVVLDDDPTGTQTVHGVPVLTTWDVETLRAEFARPGPCFYILTNSRSLGSNAAAALNRAVARNLIGAAASLPPSAGEAGFGGKDAAAPFTVVSRSDSTLRGHFPTETDVLAQELGPFDATILIPYFEAGGRYTINDVHYVAEGDALVPAAETPFARDAAFGYRSSNLREWVEEKTGGRIHAGEVVSFSIADLRPRVEARDPTRQVFEKLLGLRHGATAIVNAGAPADLDFFALETLSAEKAGGRYLFRTAAQFVAARLGLEPRPLLGASELARRETGGGLTVVGSYVPKTTQQLEALLSMGGVEAIELPVEGLLDDTRRAGITAHVVKRTNTQLSAGRDVVVFTGRQLVTGADPAESLDIGRRVSDALVAVVQGLEQRPRYLIAKGGITSSDVATKGLGVKRAMVLGQILPGVPVWELGPETKFPGLPYVVFPGNVGGPGALHEGVRILNS